MFIKLQYQTGYRKMYLFKKKYNQCSPKIAATRVLTYNQINYYQ